MCHMTGVAPRTSARLQAAEQQAAFMFNSSLQPAKVGALGNWYHVRYTIVLQRVKRERHYSQMWWVFNRSTVVPEEHLGMQ